MYESYWQLERKPFESGVDPRAYYPAESHQASLLKLRYSIENQRGGALLAGPSGCGKTLLVRMLADQLPELFRPFVHVVFPQMAPAELLAYLADELGAPAAATEGRTVDASVRRIQSRLAENAQQGRHAVLAIDEAHLLEGGRALETLRLLLNFESSSRPHLTLLLVGQTALVPAIARMPHLDERLSVKCVLRPLSLEETMGYVQHRLAAAGSSRPIFDSAATETLHQVSQGLPRQINRLCDLALLVAFAEELPSITPAQIEAVGQELLTALPG